MNLNKEQKKAIDCINHNLQIVACAGSGKTEVISRRIANILSSVKDVKPDSIVAFTFTEKAAENLKKRIEDILKESNDMDISGMYIGTIHSFCRQVLNRLASGLEKLRILDTVKEHLFAMKYYSESGMKSLGLSKREAPLFSECINKMVSSYSSMEEWPNLDKEVFLKYRTLLFEKGFINFSFLMYEVLTRSCTPEISDYFSNIKYLVVDEYQDVDDLQAQLVHEIVRRGANICVVGDDDQTIYQFRGSNANNMISFSEKYDDVVTVNLDTNYRSCSSILEVADCVIKNNKIRLSKTMKTPSGKSNGEVNGKFCESKQDEYFSLAEDIKMLHSNGTFYKDMAILIRKRSRLSDLVSGLNSHNIPFQVEENTSFFENTYYSKVCDIFRYLAEPEDNRQLIIDDWKEVCEPKCLKDGLRYLSRCNETNERFLVMLHMFFDTIGISDVSDVQKVEKGFESILTDFDQVYSKDSWTIRTNDFILFLDNMVETEYQRAALFENNKEEAVTILTVHQSKGLEFEAVFIPDMQKGFFPSNKVGGKKYYSVLGGCFEENKYKYESTEEDERKLFYVAITRAKERLYVYADLEKAELSPFINEMVESGACSFELPKIKRKTNKSYRIRHYGSEQYEEQNEEEKILELWQIYDLKSLRKDLADQYRALAHAAHCGAAYLEVDDVYKASDMELINKAISNGINVNGYLKQG